jgi:hypothetical protein
MKRKSFLLAGVLIAVFFVAYTVDAERKGPRIEIKQESVNLGKVFEGNQVRHTFEISNSGDETLVIEQVQPG